MNRSNPLPLNGAALLQGSHDDLATSEEASGEGAPVTLGKGASVRSVETEPLVQVVQVSQGNPSPRQGVELNLAQPAPDAQLRSINPEAEHVTSRLSLTCLGKKISCTKEDFILVLGSGFFAGGVGIVYSVLNHSSPLSSIGLTLALFGSTCALVAAFTMYINNHNSCATR